MASQVRVSPVLSAPGGGPRGVFVEMGGSRILVDCGAPEALSSGGFDEIRRRAKAITAILISAPTTAHMGGLPIIRSKFGVQAPAYMTWPVHRLGEIAIRENIEGLLASSAPAPLTKEELRSSLRLKSAGGSVTTVRFGETVRLPKPPSGGEPVEVTPFRAGGLLGASLWLLECGDTRVVYCSSVLTTSGNTLVDKTTLAGTISSRLRRPSLLVVDAGSTCSMASRLSTALPWAAGNAARLSPHDMAVPRVLSATTGVMARPLLTVRVKDVPAAVDQSMARGGNVLVAVRPGVAGLSIVAELQAARASAAANGHSVGTLAWVAPRFARLQQLASGAMEYLAAELGNRFIREGKPTIQMEAPQVHIVRSVGDLAALPKPLAVVASAGGFTTGPAAALLPQFAADPRNAVLIVGDPEPGTSAHALTINGNGGVPSTVPMVRWKLVPRPPEERVELAKVAAAERADALRQSLFDDDADEEMEEEDRERQTAAAITADGEDEEEEEEEEEGDGGAEGGGAAVCAPAGAGDAAAQEEAVGAPAAAATATAANAAAAGVSSPAGKAAASGREEDAGAAMTDADGGVEAEDADAVEGAGLAGTSAQRRRVRGGASDAIGIGVLVRVARSRSAMARQEAAGMTPSTRAELARQVAATPRDRFGAVELPSKMLPPLAALAAAEREEATMLDAVGRPTHRLLGGGADDKAPQLPRPGGALLGQGPLLPGGAAAAGAAAAEQDLVPVEDSVRVNIGCPVMLVSDFCSCDERGVANLLELLGAERTVLVAPHDKALLGKSRHGQRLLRSALVASKRGEAVEVPVAPVPVPIMIDPKSFRTIQFFDPLHPSVTVSGLRAARSGLHGFAHALNWSRDHAAAGDAMVTAAAGGGGEEPITETSGVLVARVGGQVAAGGGPSQPPMLTLPSAAGGEDAVSGSAGSGAMLGGSAGADVLDAWCATASAAGEAAGDGSALLVSAGHAQLADVSTELERAGMTAEIVRRAVLVGGEALSVRRERQSAAGMPDRWVLEGADEASIAQTRRVLQQKYALV